MGNLTDFPKFYNRHSHLCRFLFTESESHPYSLLIFSRFLSRITVHPEAVGHKILHPGYLVKMSLSIQVAGYAVSFPRENGHRFMQPVARPALG